MQLMPMLTELNLKSLPMVLSEDNSKVQPRIDIVLEDGKVTAYGCNGDKFVVELSPDEVLDMVVGHGLATDIYVVALAPMGRHAPFYPIVAHPNNSANDTLSRAKILELRSQACAAVRDADLYVLGVATDSDAHCRCASLVPACVRADRPGVDLRVHGCEPTRVPVPLPAACPWIMHPLRAACKDITGTTIMPAGSP